jgi:hypothetical protein
VTAAQPVRLALLGLGAALALLWAELLLTATAESPNTLVGAISATGVLAVAGLVALGCAAAADRSPRAAGIAALVATVLFALPFWAGAPSCSV